MPEMQIGEKETLRRELDETRQLLEESEHREQELRKVNQSQRERLDAVEFGLSQVDLNDMADEYELRDYIKYLMQAATGEQ